MTTVAAAAPASSRRNFLEVYLIAIGHSLTHWYPATFYVLTPVIGNELGLSYTQIASIVSAQAIAAALSNIPGGIVVDSIGRKGLLMALSLAWVGIPYTQMALTSAYWMMLVCAVVIGIGNTIWHPTAIPTLAQRFPDRKGFVISIHSMGGNVGEAVAPLVAGALLSGVIIGSVIQIPSLSWRQVMIMNVVPGFIMAIAILWQLGALRMGGSGKTNDKGIGLNGVLANLGTLVQNRTLLMLSTGSAFRAMTQSALVVFVPLYLANEMGYSPWAVGASMTGLQLAGFVAAPIAGAMSDRMGRRNIIMSSMVMTAVVLLFMIFAGDTPAFVFLVAVLGCFLFAIRAVMQAWVLESTPREMAGSAIGFLFGVQAVGAACGPLICGIVADHYGLLVTFYLMAFTIVIANLFIFFTPSIGAAAKA